MVITEQDPEKVNVMNVDAWDFYVLATSAINAAFGPQKTIRLSRLDGLCEGVRFQQIRATVDGV